MAQGPARSGARTSARSRVDHARLGEVAQGGDEGVAVGGRHEQAVDAVAHLVGEGADRAGQHGHPVAQGEQGVLRGRGRAVGQRDDVVVRHQLRDPFCGNVAGVHLDAALDARVGGQLADPAAGIPPHLAGDGEAQVGHVAQGVDEQVDALVVAHDAEREQPRRAVVVGAGQRRAAGQVRRQVELAHVLRAELGREAGLLVGVDDDGVDPAQQGLHQLPVAGVALVRQHVVRDEHACAARGRSGWCARRRRRAAARGGRARRRG